MSRKSLLVLFKGSKNCSISRVKAGLDQMCCWNHLNRRATQMQTWADAKPTVTMSSLLNLLTHTTPNTSPLHNLTSVRASSQHWTLHALLYDHSFIPCCRNRWAKAQRSEMSRSGWRATDRSRHLTLWNPWGTNQSRDAERVPDSVRACVLG